MHRALVHHCIDWRLMSIALRDLDVTAFCARVAPCTRRLTKATTALEGLGSDLDGNDELRIMYRRCARGSSSSHQACEIACIIDGRQKLADF